MWQSRTQQLYQLFNKSRREDLDIYVAQFIQEEVQKYIVPTIRFVSFELEHDEGWYISDFTCRDNDGRIVDLEDEDNIKPEYIVDEDLSDDVPDWDDLRNDVSIEIAHDLFELRLNNQRFDLFEKKEE